MLTAQKLIVMLWILLIPLDVIVLWCFWNEYKKTKELEKKSKRYEE